MYCDVTHYLELLRPVELDISDHYGSCPSSCDGTSASLEDSGPLLTPKKQVIRIIHGALKKKDFFSHELCPLYFSEKYKI